MSCQLWQSHVPGDDDQGDVGLFVKDAEAQIRDRSSVKVMASDTRARNLVLALIAGLTGVRLLLSAQVGLGDAEAYYWVWSRHLAWSYLDHGPVVAWFIAASTAIFGQTPFGVRALFVIASALAMAILAWLAAQLSPFRWRASLAAIVAIMCLPMFFIAGAAANPDGPLILFVLAVVAALNLARRRRRPSHDGHDDLSKRSTLLSVSSLGWLTLAGLIAGLATSSKLFGALLLAPLGASIWQFFRRTPSIAEKVTFAVAPLASFALGAAPVFLWNARHAWASFVYHLVGRHQGASVGLSLVNLGKLIGGQMAYVAPLPFLGLVWAFWGLWHSRRDPSSWLIFLSALPFLGAGTLLILIIPGAEPHWPAVGYLPLLPALGHCVTARWRARRGLRVIAIIAMVFSATVFLGFQVHVLTDLGVRLMPPSYVPRYDLSNELLGWPTVAEHIVRLQRKGHGRSRVRASSRPLVVAACHYTTCSQLRFAARGRFEVICPSPRIDAFDFLPGGDGSMRRGIDLLYVQDERFPFRAELLYRCAATRVVDTIHIRRGGRIVRRFKLVHCDDFCGLRALHWPPPARSP